MPQNIINTVFPVTQGFDSVPAEVRPPYSPGAGINDVNESVVKAGEEAPGVGVPSQSFKRTPASVSAPNSVAAGAEAPGVGATNDSPEDDSNHDAGDGPVTVARVETALGRVDGGLLMPGGTPVFVGQNTVANQVLGVGQPVNVRGGAT